MAVELAASLASAAAQRGDPFALSTAEARVGPGTGAAQLERVLDALARARLRADAPRTDPPVPARECVRVTTGAADGRWGDVYTPAREAK